MALSVLAPPIIAPFSAADVQSATGIVVAGLTHLSTATTLSKANSAAPIGMPSVEMVIEKLPASGR